MLLFGYADQIIGSFYGRITKAASRLQPGSSVAASCTPVSPPHAPKATKVTVPTTDADFECGIALPYHCRSMFRRRRIPFVRVASVRRGIRSVVPQARTPPTPTSAPNSRRETFSSSAAPESKTVLPLHYLDMASGSAQSPTWQRRVSLAAWALAGSACVHESPTSGTHARLAQPAEARGDHLAPQTGTPPQLTLDHNQSIDSTVALRAPSGEWVAHVETTVETQPTSDSIIGHTKHEWLCNIGGGGRPEFIEPRSTVVSDEARAGGSGTSFRVAPSPGDELTSTVGQLGLVDPKRAIAMFSMACEMDPMQCMRLVTSLMKEPQTSSVSTDPERRAASLIVRACLVLDAGACAWACESSRHENEAFALTCLRFACSKGSERACRLAQEQPR